MKNRSVIGMSLAFLFAGCLGTGSATNEAVGYAALSLHAAQDFNPNVVHGEISEYKVTIAGEALPSPLVRYYPAGTSEARLEGLPAGSFVTVTVEYLNVNGLVVRRGYSGNVAIRGGAVTPVEITLNNVPIFANVGDGAVVRSDRFVPTIFAPGEITVQISDEFNGEDSVLTDSVSGEASLSVSVDDSSSLLTFRPSTLSSGIHELTVQDLETGEASTITVTVLPANGAQELVTTAGGLTGLPMSSDPSEGLNAAVYYGQNSTE